MINISLIINLAMRSSASITSQSPTTEGKGSLVLSSCWELSLQRLASHASLVGLHAVTKVDLRLGYKMPELL